MLGMTKQDPSQKLIPAAALIERLGGITVVMDAIGTGASSTVHRWTYPKARGGTAGLIPQRHIPALMEFARDRGIEVSAEDFIPTPSTEAA